MTKPMPSRRLFWGLPGDPDSRPASYGRVYERKVWPTTAALIIDATDGPVDLLLELTQDWPGPYGALFLDFHHARFAVPLEKSREEIVLFLATFRDFLELGPDFNLWLASAHGMQIVWDEHDYFYAYGDEELYMPVLRRRGFSPGLIRVQSPHMHLYGHDKGDLERLMSYWGWIESPLLPSDEH